MRTCLSILLLGLSSTIYAQSAETQKALTEGNRFYKEQQFVKAANEYAKVLSVDPRNTVARFNNANALYKQDKKVEAVQVYSELAVNSLDQSLRNKTWYNKGVILTNQKNTIESIEAYKNALRNEPSDVEARENLQKALLDLKKENEEKKKQKEQPQPKKEQQKNQSQSKMQPKEADQRLRLLQQKEREVQERVQKEKTKTGGSQQKDW